MKAMALTGIRKISIHDVPQPTIQHPTEVLLRIMCVGICGSDVHYYATGRIGSHIVRYPFRVGHECSAVVEQVGVGVTRLKRGDRVAVDPTIACERCDQCRVGRVNTCRNQLFLGCPGQIEGCLCEYLVMPEICCHPIGSLSLEQAALAEPLAIGVYAVRSAGPLKDKNIAIQGVGAIGLSVLLAGRLEEPAAVYVTDKRGYRLDLARNHGAGWVGNPDQTDIVHDIQQHEPLQMDVVFECCGQQEALDQAVDLLKPGGKLMIVGIPEVDRVSFPIHALRRKELTLVNVRRQNGCEQATLDLIREGRVKPDFMMTHRFPLDDVAKAFDLVDRYEDGVIRAMIDISSP